MHRGIVCLVAENVEGPTILLISSRIPAYEARALRNVGPALPTSGLRLRKGCRACCQPAGGTSRGRNRYRHTEMVPRRHGILNRFVHCTNGNAKRSLQVIGVLQRLEEEVMPIVLLWVGVPVLLLGGGYFIVHAMH
jgi:hypothetical protein